MIHVKKGNILDIKNGIIVQQVNCVGVMGAGLANQIRRQYPGIYDSYLNFIATHTIREDSKSSTLLGMVHKYRASDSIIICNCFGQDGYGRDRRHTNYSALKTALERVRTLSRQQHASISIPWGIGCGLAGGDWDTAMGIMLDVFQDHDATLYFYYPLK